ncbi:ATP synthase F0 subunit B [Candidatus Dependentiae bacterium]
MQVNLTFFVQLINFGISYWFLNKFMFKPVMEYVNRRKDEKNKTLKDINNKEQILLNLEKDKNKKLFDFKVNMKSEYSLKPFKAPDIPSTILSKVDKQESEKLIKIVKNMLIQRVPHVD